jgi:general transcription factor 3C polypeptide 3 (transcription factor C subunit 4)
MGKRRRAAELVDEGELDEEMDEEESEEEEEEEDEEDEEDLDVRDGDFDAAGEEREAIQSSEAANAGEVLEDDEQNDYQLQFESGMDPMVFAEEDASGVAPFQQFEKLEYEALAARKRKVLALKRGMGRGSTIAATRSVAKKQKNELFGASIDEIWDSAGMGAGGGGRGGGRRRKKKKKLGRPKGSTLTPETRKKLGEANVLYAIGKFDEAVEVLKEVVRIAPNVPDSYHTLGLLYDAMGDRKKALNFYMIAAHLTPKDTVLWKRLASWSMYCLFLVPQSSLDMCTRLVFC